MPEAHFIGKISKKEEEGKKKKRKPPKHTKLNVLDFLYLNPKHHSSDLKLLAANSRFSVAFTSFQAGLFN